MKGVFWGGVGGVFGTYISPKGVCDGGVKNRGCRCYSGQNETQSGQNDTQSGQFIPKVGKSALELRKNNSIISFNDNRGCSRTFNPKSLVTLLAVFLSVGHWASALALSSGQGVFGMSLRNFLTQPRF